MPTALTASPQSFTVRATLRCIYEIIPFLGITRAVVQESFNDVADIVNGQTLSLAETKMNDRCSNTAITVNSGNDHFIKIQLTGINQIECYKGGFLAS